MTSFSETYTVFTMFRMPVKNS